MSPVAGSARSTADEARTVVPGRREGGANLSLKDGLRGSLRENSKSTKDTGYSKAYHRFFEGYSEITVPDRNGKGTRIQRIYTGDYYRQDLTNRQRIWIRVLYVALFLCIACLYASSATLPLPINSTWYVVLPEAASVAFLFWIVVALLSYLPAKQDMTIRAYRSSSLALLKATLGSALCLSLAALASLVFIVLNRPAEPWPELLLTGKLLVGGLLALAMYRMERRVNYPTIGNPQRPPENSFEIN